jgi:hypothetical protein
MHSELKYLHAEASGLKRGESMNLGYLRVEMGFCSHLDMSIGEK